MPQPIQFPTRSDPGPVKFTGEPRLRNVFPEFVGKDKKRPVVLNAIPGQTTFAAVADVSSRGMIELEDETVAYSIHGHKAYRVNPDGTSSALAGFVQGLRPVQMERGAKRYASAEVTITIGSPAVVNWPRHNLVAGEVVRFSSSGSLPGGVEPDKDYYVSPHALTANSFCIEATNTFAALDKALGSNTGNMTSNGGLAAAFDGNSNQAAAACAMRSGNPNGSVGKTLPFFVRVGSMLVSGSNNAGYWGGSTSTSLIILGSQGGGSPVDIGSSVFNDVTNESAARTIMGTDQNVAYDGISCFIGRTGNGTGTIAEVTFNVIPLVTTSGTQSGEIIATRTKGTYQVVIVADAKVYCIEDNRLFEILDDLELDEPAISATYLDSRWVFGFPSGRYYWSELGDCSQVGPESYRNAEARPDGLIRAIEDRGELWLLGGKTIEIHTGSTDPDEPFVPLGGAFIPIGCASRDSVVKFDNALHWVGDDGVVYRAAGGYAYRRISGHAVETAIESVADKTTIAGYTYTHKGHAFYVLTCDLWTWVFDAATGHWHERCSRFRPDWRAWPYCRAFGKQLVGDKWTGEIRELSDDVFTEAGEPIRCELGLPDIPGRVSYHYLEVDVATGVGLNVAPDAPGYDPLLMLTWSDDGGYTWSDERIEALGRQGDRLRRVRFEGLGTSKERGRRFMIACSDPVLKSFFLGDIGADRVDPGP